MNGNIKISGLSVPIGTPETGTHPGQFGEQNARLYAKVDLQRGTLGWVTSSVEGSSLKDIHAFAMKHMEKLSPENVKLLSIATSSDNKATRKKSTWTKLFDFLSNAFKYPFIRALIKINSLAHVILFKYMEPKKTDVEMFNEISDRADEQRARAKFSKESRVHVPGGDEAGEKIATDFAPRAYTPREIKAEHGYVRRAPDDSLSVKEQMRARSREEVTPSSGRISFESLRGQKVDEEEFVYAAREKLQKLSIDLGKRLGAFESDFVVMQLSNLIEQLPRDDIKTLADLERELIKQIEANNVQEEEMDKETFQLLTDDGKGGKPVDIMNAPEFRKARTDLKNKTWPDGESRTFHLTVMKEDTLGRAKDVISALFKDEAACEAMQQFLTQEAE